MSAAPKAAAGQRPAGTGPRPESEVPRPRAPRWAQSSLAIVRPLEYRLALRRRHGPVFRTRDVLGGDIVHLAEPELVERLFKLRPAQYSVGDARRVMEPVLGPYSLLLLDGDRHLRMRRLMLPPFHGEAIAHFAALIDEIAERELRAWRPGATVSLRALAQAVTMEAIIRAVFGITDAARVAELKRLLPRLSGVSPVLALESLRRDLGPRSPWGRLVRALARVDAILFEEMARRRRAGEENDDGQRDILGLLLAARDEDGRPLGDRELRDELVTLLAAGNETTATAIGWAFERLLRTPQALARLVEEVGGAGAAGAARGSGDYLDAVIKETLRVRPVVSEVFRTVTEPVELGGYRFQPGTLLAASVAIVQLDARLYPPDPLAFRPERFLEGAADSYAWIPFGGGVRRCIGAAFALLEMRVVIAAVLRRAVLRAPGPRPEGARFRGVTLVPNRGARAVVERLELPG